MPEEIELTKAEFDELGEYSGCSLPTGTSIGKRWKRNEDAYGPRSSISLAEEKMGDVFPDWWMGEYYELNPPVKDTVGIRWKKIRLKKETP